MNLNFKLTMTVVTMSAALMACGESTTSPSSNSSTNPSASEGSSADAYPLFSSYAGHYAGSWNNTTYSTQGSMTWDISVDSGSRQSSIKVTASGGVFGTSGVPTETITLTNLAQGAVSGQTTSFGSLSGTVTPAGVLTVTMSSIPGGSIDHVTATGQFSGNNKITLQYTVYFVGGGSNATGTVTLNKA